MKRYTIAFLSLSTGTALEYASGETPAEALKKGKEADARGLRDVRIIDRSTEEALNPQAFAAKHRL